MQDFVLDKSLLSEAEKEQILMALQGSLLLKITNQKNCL